MTTLSSLIHVGVNALVGGLGCTPGTFAFYRISVLDGSSFSFAWFGTFFLWRVSTSGAGQAIRV